MKHSSGQATNYEDESPQASYARMVRRPPSRSHNETNRRRQEIPMDQRGTDAFRPASIILGSFSNPPTYVIHYLDPHLAFYQNFQLCSLYGRVRIHGYNLPPATFCSISNYRIGTPLAIEYLPPTMTITRSLQEINSFIRDEQLAQFALLNVEEKGGDILLLRKDPNNDSTFIKTIREHRMYSQWFLEKHQSVNRDPWRQLERDLQIRLIETTDQTAVISRPEFIDTTDRIIARWLSEATEDSPFIVLICGEKDMGKSTFTRYLINRALNHINPAYGLTYFDCDIGQCEFTMGGCLSYIDLDSPLLGPPCSHIESNPKPNRLLYYGLVSPQPSPIRYLQYVDRLRKLWNQDHINPNSKRSMILINTMGWGTGLGLDLLKETICMSCPNMIVQLGESLNVTQDPNKMPDVTLQWLSEQPVFVPYRRKIQMSDKRQDDYDGRLNYEYAKLRSAAPPPPPSNTPHTETRKLRPRDLRLLAAWSYFFSSNLSRLRLPWSQFVHVPSQENLQKNFNDLPGSLQHSIVALCSVDNIDQWRSSANDIHGILHQSDCQDEVFECLGFGWIERCDKQNQIYEIFTPIDGLTDINLLVSGAFDTPEEFEYMFRRVFVQ